MPQKSLELEESDGQEPFDFPPPERRITTQPYDLSVQTLLEQWSDGLLQVPEIQREYVWDNGRASRLIESLILNIPIPPLYFAETPEARFHIIDGHQRVRSIVRYLEDDYGLTGLRVLSEYKGLRFQELPAKEQRFLRTRSLRVVIIAHNSHPSMKFEVFERLNTGGIVLNAQELRNSLYRGRLNELLHELAKDKSFRNCIGTRTPRPRMVDEELVLRFLAFRDRLDEYRPPLTRFLNKFMDDNKNPDDAWLKERAASFRQTMKRIESVLHRQAFRLIDRHGESLKDERGHPLPRGVNRALFDAQALAFSWVQGLAPDRRRESILAHLSEALQREDLQDATRRATGDKARILARIRIIVAALGSARVRTRPPDSLED